MTTETLCGCMKCIGQRVDALRATGERRFTMTFPGPGVPGWRFWCELCGNKRCPHHSDHTLACTDSNEPGQPGSNYQ